MFRKLLVPMVAVVAAIALDSGRLPATDLLEETSGSGAGCGSLTDYIHPDGQDWAHGGSAPGGWQTYATFYNRNNAHGGYFARRTEQLSYHSFCN